MTMRRMFLGMMVLVGGLGAGCVDDVAGIDAVVRPFPVRDGFLRDGDGRSVILRGANLSTEHKTAPYLGFHGPAEFNALRTTWGMNSVRFLVSWAGIEPAPGQYDDAYLDAIAERLDWARDAGLLVVLDLHQDLYGEGFGVGNGAPTWTCDASNYEAFTSDETWFFNYLDPAVTACYDHFWQTESLWDAYGSAAARLAARFADHPAVVGLDLMNEPYWGSYELDRFDENALQPFYEHIIPMVRAAAPGFTLFVEPASSRNLGIATGLRPLPFDDLVYAPHSYDTGAERGAGFDDAHRQQLIDNLAALRQEAIDLGMALWIGEYGGMTSSPGIGPYMDATYDGAAAVGASSMVWQYGRADDYGLIGDDGLGKPEMLAVLVRPTPSRVAGTPVSFSFDDATRTFVVVMTPEATVAAPTEIIVPTAIAPDGVDVSCDAACDVSVDGDVVSVRGGDVTTITVQLR